MDFKRDYYQKENEFWNRIHEEEEQRKAELTEEELAKEKEQNRIEADEFIERCKEKQKGIYHIVSPGRVERFREMVSVADEFAKIQSLDIHAWTTDKVGKIKLSGSNLVVTYNTPKEDRLNIGRLFYYAEDAFVSAKGGIIEMDFIFRLCEEA